MKNIIYAILLVCFGMIFGQLAAYNRIATKSETKRDTITLTREVHTSGTETSIDVAKYEVPKLVFMKAVPETIFVSQDTMLVREQKEYRDSTYDAWVSGIDARLDSIRTFARNTMTHDTITRYINQTITNTIMKKVPKLKLGITAGYGITPKGFQPCAVFGATITF